MRIFQYHHNFNYEFVASADLFSMYTRNGRSQYWLTIAIRYSPPIPRHGGLHSCRRSLASPRNVQAAHLAQPLRHCADLRRRLACCLFKHYELEWWCFWFGKILRRTVFRVWSLPNLVASSYMYTCLWICVATVFVVHLQHPSKYSIAVLLHLAKDFINRKLLPKQLLAELWQCV